MNATQIKERMRELNKRISLTPATDTQRRNDYERAYMQLATMLHNLKTK